jgi:cobalt-zinc-cadmium efflux system protein
MSGHTHEHASASSRRLAIALGISAVVLVAQAVGAVATGSLALLVDAGHVLTDTAGLAVALGAVQLGDRPATSRRTYGWARAEVLAATLQAAVLLAVGLFVLVEGVRRLIDPPQVPGGALLLFGLLGLVGNLIAVAVLLPGRSLGFNRRAAFLEVVNDALGSAGVVVAALVIAATGWVRADSIAAVLIGVLIVPRTLLLLRDTVDVLLESAPRGLDLEAVRRHLIEQPHVLAVHDLHASQISSALPVLTAHVVVERSCFTNGAAPAVLDALQRCVAEHFPVLIEHSTFQLEPPAHLDHETPTHA